MLICFDIFYTHGFYFEDYLGANSLVERYSRGMIRFYMSIESIAMVGHEATVRTGNELSMGVREEDWWKSSRFSVSVSKSQKKHFRDFLSTNIWVVSKRYSSFLFEFEENEQVGHLNEPKESTGN